MKLLVHRTAMGLDTSHNCWHGAYGIFARFRELLALAAGYEVVHSLDEDGELQTRIALNYKDYPSERYQGVWPETPKEPLLVLLIHSDCDGAIYPEQAVPLADRIEELLPKLRRVEEMDYYRDYMTQFIVGLRDAASSYETVTFH